MDNELIERKNWFQSNWKWVIPLVLSLALISGYLFSSSDENIMDFAQAYNDTALYEKAIEKANSNQRVLETVGEIQPIDKLAILEGNTIYTDNNTSVVLSIRIKGTKSKGKLDITAKKMGAKWNYKKILVRCKNPKEEITVVDSH
ncbi:MAG: cytochrome c oxidase assembly factor Coa1 family protein [Flavobacterium sp.]